MILLDILQLCDPDTTICVGWKYVGKVSKFSDNKLLYRRVLNIRASGDTLEFEISRG